MKSIMQIPPQQEEAGIIHSQKNFLEQFPQSITVRIKLTKGGRMGMSRCS